MSGDQHIRDKLAKLEALFARGTTEGERAAAGAARDRLQERLGYGFDENAEPEVELKMSLNDTWSVRLFIAICRKHGVSPYRYPRQRRTTLMVNVQESVFDETVWKEYCDLQGHLFEYINEMVEHLISDAMRSDGSDDNLDQKLLNR